MAEELISLPTERVERRLAAILAADVAGYSRLMGTDEEGTLAQLKTHRKDLVDPKITEHRGRIEAPKPVTTKHLAYELAEQHQLTKKQGLEMMEELVGMITKHLKKGERVKIAGVGILQVRHRAARMGRNPATGEAIQNRASKKVAFRATKELKMAI
jgi:DNA-binding protein HU-beta